MEYFLEWFFFSYFFFNKLCSGHKVFSLLVSHGFFKLLMFLYSDGPFFTDMSCCPCSSRFRNRFQWWVHIYVCKLLIFNNNFLCYFLHFVVWEGNAWVFRKNINKRKMEVLARVEHFLLKAFNYFYIAIWFYVKFEDVLEVFPMLI